jgi:hypothetical protein
MSKEKLVALTKYSADLKAKLSSPVPTKHKNRESQYKKFLEKELKTTDTKVEGLKLMAADKK